MEHTNEEQADYNQRFVTSEEERKIIKDRLDQVWRANRK